ncbi:MAG: rod shape-determining protein MreD [Gammaproteobacteria bacterium]|nr:MAG: rod shape-determining protein MreD [Gammaproteobacteria bacterium]RKZ95550.1 MAG: rod shape-determining protein MreD [Gammaproteobacteria bacterium]RKZ97711.1 MAG: rod shape-determining protein MreD [Gammaproteobacteria bacterium]RLA01727.1 MAG: rod shape-determining protein MreD [Gammaproteobacteria bacterium]
MAENQKSHGGIIIFTIVFAMLLMLLPLPDSLRFFRPEWVLITLIYWAMAVPRLVGVGFAWVVGLLMDVMMGGAMGVLAFSYTLVIYLVLQFHLQLRQYPLWQQALSILSLVLLVDIVTVLVSPTMAGWHVWLPAVSSTVLWPVMYSLLRTVRRTFNVS